MWGGVVTVGNEFNFHDHISLCRRKPEGPKKADLGVNGKEIILGGPDLLGEL